MRFLLRRSFRYYSTDSQMDFSWRSAGLARLFAVLPFRASRSGLQSRAYRSCLQSRIYRASPLSLSCRFSLSLAGLPSKEKQSLTTKSIEASISPSSDSALCCRCRPLLEAQMRCTRARQLSSTRSTPTRSRAISTSTSRRYISASASHSPSKLPSSCAMLLTPNAYSFGSEAVRCSSAIDTADFLSFLPKVRFWKGSAGSVESREGWERCSLRRRARFCSMISISFIRSQLILSIGLKVYISINCMEQAETVDILQPETWQWNWKVLAAILITLPLLKFALLLLVTLVKQLIPMPDLIANYCSRTKRSWAVVTGATDGIGLGFCEVLTQLGFNVLLISRNPEKLEKTKESLAAMRPAHFASSELRTIAFNFKDSSDPAKWEALLSELRQLDIALLVNNVGISDIKAFQAFSFEFIVDIININCVGMAALSAEVARLMANRGRRSAMINLSSFLGEKSLPYLTLYSATKAFNRELSNSLALECPFIDVLTLKPMFVESPLSQQKRGFGVPDRRECAWDSLKELRWTSETYGYFSHRIMGHIAREFVPEWLYRFTVWVSAKKALKKMFPENKLQ